MKELKDLTEEQFNKLKNSKLLKDFFPNAPETYKEIKEIKEIKGIKPKILDNPNIEPLRSIVQEYVDYVASDDFCEDNDWSHYIFETIMEVFYGGKDFWKWHNKQC